MKLRIETNMDFGQQDAEFELEITDTSPTLRSVLDKLSLKNTDDAQPIIDPATKNIDPDAYMVTINGRTWDLLPQRLDTILKEGDRIAVKRWLELIGGG